MDKNIYNITRLKLTLLYFAIIFAIVLFFSTLIINSEYNEISRFEHFQQYKQLIDPFANNQDFETTINDVKTNLLLQVLYTDLIILIISGILSYYLSGKTLEPIEETMRKQKEFIANASHEFKTPLTAMTTEAEVLLRSERSNNQYKAFTQNVLEEAQRLSKLTIQLLNIAKSDEHITKLNITEIDLIALINFKIERFLPIAKSKNIKISVDSDVAALNIKTDKEKIAQLLEITLDNAIKYNKENGEVRVKIKINNESLKLVIEDTGVGIDKDNLTKIFDRFYRASNDRNEKGFGLGLSIAKNIVDLLKGEINIKSNINQGTKVMIELPFG